MGERELRTLLEGGDFYEGPRFESGRWWVSDFYTHQVLAVGVDGESEVIMEVEGQPSGLGWLPDGTLLVVSMKDHRILRRFEDGDVDEHADLSAHCGGHLNDMVVDDHGRTKPVRLRTVGRPRDGNLRRGLHRVGPAPRR